MILPHEPVPLRLLGEPDQLFERGPYPRRFEFNREVAQVFDDMVSRSVPLYREVLHSLVEWAYLSYQPGTAIYDIGCSTGTSLLAVGSQLADGAHLIGIDTSEPMLERARLKLAELDGRHKLELLCTDALALSYKPASVVIVNYTLQFIPVRHRLLLLKRLWAALQAGGILFVSEKVRSSSPEVAETITRAYEAFKQRAGYSLTEIARKKEALDEVLIPLTLDEQMAMLGSAGFTHCELIMKWNNFASFVAIKK